MIKGLLKKQSGYALVLVLLLIAIIGILIPPIITNIMSSKLQFNKAEQNIQLEKLREMGIAYMESVVNEAINELDIDAQSLNDIEQYKSNVISNMYRIIPEIKNGMTKVFKENNQQFSLEITSVEIVTDSEIKIHYNVIPSLKGSIDDAHTSKEEVSIHITYESE